MATGAYVRIKRDGKWQAVEIDALTDEELEGFFGGGPTEGAKWAKFLARWIRDHIVSEEQPPDAER